MLHFVFKLLIQNSPHEEIMSWNWSYFCPGSINFAMLTIFLTAVVMYYIFSYSTALLDKPYSSTLLLFFKFLLVTLRNGFKQTHQPLLPLTFTIFLWFYVTNLMSALPFTISLTTVLPIILLCALMTFGTANLLGIYQHKLKFLNLFLPPGAPKLISFLLVPVELIAYWARLISLTARLFANMLSGYILMEIMFSFLLLAGQNILVTVVPSIILFILVFCVAMLKILIAFLQAYIFSLLVSFYLNDPIELH